MGLLGPHPKNELHGSRVQVDRRMENLEAV